MLQATTTNQYEMEDEPLIIKRFHENSEKASLILGDDICNVHNKRSASRSYIECWQIKKGKKWRICYLYSRKEDSWSGVGGDKFPKLRLCEHKERAPQGHATVWCQQQVWARLVAPPLLSYLLCPKTSRLQAPASNFVSLWVVTRHFNLIWFSLTTAPIK